MYEDTIYRRHFLTQVVARFDFVAPIPGIDKALPPKLANLFTTHFPIAEPQDATTLQVTFGESEPKQSKTLFKQWNFFGKQRQNQLTLGPQFMFIVYTKYTSYEEMRNTITAIVTAVESTFPDTKAARFGLRYINSIEIEGLNPVTGWADFISPALLAADGFFPPEKLTRMISSAEIKCGEIDLRFQFGLPNPDYPAVVRRASFILDFDAYTQTAHDLSVSRNHMDQAHECIQSLFERSITDTLREIMNA